MGDTEDPAVSRFRDYLRINTVSLLTPDTEGPQPNYGIVTRIVLNKQELLRNQSTF